MKCSCFVASILLFYQISFSQSSGSLTLGIHGPVQILFTDSQGRKSGSDPTSGNMYQEIPNSIFDYQCCGNIDPNDSTDPGWEISIVNLTDPMFADSYIVKLEGVGQGIYNGAIAMTRSDDDPIMDWNIVGVIDNNQSVSYILRYSRDITKPLSFEKYVDTLVLRQDLTNCYALNLLRNSTLFLKLGGEIGKISTDLTIHDTLGARFELLQFDILIDKASSDTSNFESSGYKILKEDVNTLFSSLPPNITPSTPVPQYTLTVTDSGNGSVTKNPDLSSYDSASSILITATPSSGYSFTAWSGDASGSTNPLSLVMNGNKNVMAAFRQSTFIITASAGANGAISPNGAVNVSYGGNQVFTFTPNTGYYVDSLIVDGTKQTSASSYTFNSVSSNHTIRVTFSNQYTLTILITGGGTVTVSPNNSSYSYGTSVRMTAHNASGGQSMIKPNNPEPKSWRFDHWELDASGSTNPKDITINANKTVRAVFVAVY
jgi:hypothetical protein